MTTILAIAPKGGGGGSGVADFYGFVGAALFLSACAYWRASRAFGWRFWTWPWGDWFRM